MQRILVSVWFPAPAWVAIACGLAVASAACQRESSKSRAAEAEAGDPIATAVQAFLKDGGHLCLAKTSWPIDVTEQDMQSRTNDAIQMPVLERVGLVSSTHVESGRSYALTELGRRSYVMRKFPEPSFDLCAGKIELDRIVDVQHQAPAGGAAQVIVRYTYHFAAAEWVRNPEVQAVFPMLAQILAGERAASMELRFKRTASGWVALDPRA